MKFRITKNPWIIVHESRQNGVYMLQGSFDIENWTFWTSQPIGLIRCPQKNLAKKDVKILNHQKSMDYGPRKLAKWAIYLLSCSLTYKMDRFGRQGQLASFLTY